MKLTARYIALLAVAALVCYWNTFDNPFHLDDFYRIAGNPGVQQLHPIFRHFVDPRTNSQLKRLAQYRPLPTLSFSINYYFTGDSFPAYHLTSLAFQIINAILAYLIGVRLLGLFAQAVTPRRERIAFFAALLFIVHPVSGIPINYICCRDLLMMQTFLEASLLLYLEARTSVRPRMCLALSYLTLALSLLCKPNAVALPLLLLAFELSLDPANLRRLNTYLRVAPHVAIILLYFVYTKYLLGFSDVRTTGLTSQQAPLYFTQIKLQLFEYMVNFVYPFQIRQAPFVAHESSLFSPHVLLSAIFILFTFWLAGRSFKSNRLASFCICSYWILMLPESMVAPFVQAVSDYRPYPSSTFLYLLLASLVFSKLAARGATVVCSAVAVYLLASSWYLNATWRTEERLWAYSVEHGGSALAHLSLAMSIPDRSDPRVRFEMEKAIQMAPEYTLAHVNLGTLLIERGETEQGLSELLKARAISPQSGQVSYALGDAYGRLGRDEEAFESYKLAADFDPPNILYQYAAASKCSELAKFPLCLKWIERVEQIDPDYGQIRFLRAYAEQSAGHAAEAVAAYRIYLKAHPDDAQANFNLAFTLKEQGKCAEAVPLLEKALTSDAQLGAAHFHLAECYETMGDARRAEEHRKAFERGPQRR